MESIHAHTKIATLIHAHPGALEAIVSVSPHFAKLRNPLFRKLMAGRTSIVMAAKMGGCSVEDIFDKLRPLGFEVSEEIPSFQADTPVKDLPPYLANLDPGHLVELNVIPILEAGQDPLEVIIKKVNAMEKGYVLKIINSFEPTPLMQLLGKKGFISTSFFVSPKIVHTYFYKKENAGDLAETVGREDPADWEKYLHLYEDRLTYVDVRNMKPPLPMHTILEALESLPQGRALFVYHNRIPTFLLPELKDRQFSYRINVMGEEEVHLIIYRD